MRQTLVAGNWKMNNTVQNSLKFITEFSAELKAAGQVETVIIPPATSLYSVGVALADTEFKLGAQNLFWEDSGAYTGEISPVFLKEVGCKFVVVGHSERRTIFGETNDDVSKKVNAAISHEIIPIMCVGETLDERESGNAWNIIESQLSDGLKNINLPNANAMVVAYEPLWAIGTGKTATPEQAQEMHASIRGFLSDKFGKAIGEEMRLLYGGSVKPSNSRSLFVKKDIDGALVGGAALDAVQFADIIRSAH